MNWKVNEKCPAEIDFGIVVDYVNGSFVMLLKDETWSEEEVEAFLKHHLHLSFLYERICGMFLFEIEDGIEVSDASFDIHMCDEAAALLDQGECYGFEIYLLDAENQICAARKVTLSKNGSAYIRSCLKKQMETPYDEEGFDHALMKVQGSAHPFELAERAALKESF